MLQIFIMDMVEYIYKKVRGPDSMKCMHMISRDGDHSEGWGVGVNCCLEPFRKFISFGTLARPKDWYDYWSLFQSVSCLIILNTIVEQTYPEP